MIAIEVGKGYEKQVLSCEWRVVRDETLNSKHAIIFSHAYLYYPGPETLYPIPFIRAAGQLCLGAHPRGKRAFDLR